MDALGNFYAELPAQIATPVASPHEHVLGLFQSMAHEVPAYARFLAEHGVDAARVDSLEALARVPATTKDNYHRANVLSDGDPSYFPPGVKHRYTRG